MAYCRGEIYFIALHRDKNDIPCDFICYGCHINPNRKDWYGEGLETAIEHMESHGPGRDADHALERLRGELTRREAFDKEELD